MRKLKIYLLKRAWLRELDLHSRARNKYYKMAAELDIVPEIVSMESEYNLDREGAK
jgi:hypothetical protein